MIGGASWVKIARETVDLAHVSEILPAILRPDERELFYGCEHGELGAASGEAEYMLRSEGHASGIGQSTGATRVISVGG